MRLEFHLKWANRTMIELDGQHVHIAKVVGESDEGLTLFVPKDEHGVFHLEEGDEFLTIRFIKADGRGSVTSWTPWDEHGVRG